MWILKKRICKVCGKTVGNIYKHLLNQKDDKHKEFLQKQEKYICELFYDANFTRNNFSQYEDKIYCNYKGCCDIWHKYFGTEKCLKRKKKIVSVRSKSMHPKHIYKKCPVCNKMITNFGLHFKCYNDKYHQDLFREEKEKIIKLFMDLNFTTETIEIYDLLLTSYKACCSIWQEYFGKQLTKERGIILLILARKLDTFEWNQKRLKWFKNIAKKKIQSENIEQDLTKYFKFVTECKNRNKNNTVYNHNNHDRLIKCPVCGKFTYKPLIHFRMKKDDKHKEFLQKQEKYICELFYDDNFNKDTKNQYTKLIMSMKFCYSVWKKNFSLEERNLRQQRLTAKALSVSLKGRTFSTEWRNKLSVSQAKSIKNTQRNSKRSLAGYRKDIGHYAASTYEANIFRIFQYEHKRYKTEFQNIFPLKYEHGIIHNYRIDVLDIDGLFGIKGAYIEIKGWMDVGSIKRIVTLRQQYKNKKLLTLGKNPCKNWHYDIDYNQLTKIYKPLIKLWEDGEQNIKNHSELYV